MTRLSELQFPMLREFAGLGRNEYMSIERAQMFDQRPFRSMLKRQWVTYVRGHGFHITGTGRDAWFDFQNRDIFRHNQSAPLTKFFNPMAFGLRQPYKHTGRTNVIPMRKTA